MNYLIYDCETSGFIQKKLPYDHPDQCRLVQLACILIDEKFKELSSFYSIVKLPENKTIDDGAFNAHGISTADCGLYGMRIETVLDVFDSMAAKAGAFIAHNIKFDAEVIAIEYFHRMQKMPNGRTTYCTMQLMTDVCKLPNIKMRGTWKWPKLSEAYSYLGNKVVSLPILNAHDSLSDCRACAEIFKWLLNNNRIPQLVSQH